VEPAASILPGNTTIVAESMPPTTIFVDTSGPNPQVTGTATDTAPRLASTVAPVPQVTTTGATDTAPRLATVAPVHALSKSPK